MKYKAVYKSQSLKIGTRKHDTPEEAWSALERGLRRRGVDAYPFPFPGTVAGDLYGIETPNPRLSGVAHIELFTE